MAVTYTGYHVDMRDQPYSLYRREHSSDVPLGLFPDFSRMVLCFEEHVSKDYEREGMPKMVKVISGNKHGGSGLPYHDARALRARATTHNRTRKK